MLNVEDALIVAGQTYRHIYFRPNPGNAGDSLLNVGFYSIAKRVGLRYKEIDDDFPFESLAGEDLVILSGGGNIVPYWKHGSEVIRKLTQYNFPLMLMPQSVEQREDVLRLLRSKDILFLRERYSFDYASSLGLKCTIALDHDLAFHADLKKLNSGDKWYATHIPTSLHKSLYIAYHYINSRFNKRLVALRTDRESTISGQKSKLNDISRITRFGTRSQEKNILSSRWLLKILSWYDTIETDRLHVFIGCLLVGTKVVLREGVYHKIKGVYEHSVQSDPSYVKLVNFVARPTRHTSK